MPTLSQVSRLSLKTILLPTDFSLASYAALRFARTLAQIYGSKIVIVHSIAPEPHRQIVVDRLHDQDDRTWQEAREKLEAFAKDSSWHAIPQTTLLDQGGLDDVIPEIIQEHAVDLVVLGTHGRLGISKMVLGSAAEQIYRSATCPVLTVGPRVRETAEWKLSRILCPIEAVEDSRAALQFALSLAEENQSELTVLQAMPLVPWQHRDAVEMQARLNLERLIPETSKDWCTPQFVVRWEHPVEAILQESQQREAELIVMSVRKSHASAWASHLPWPIASEVMSRAPCPVLTIRV